VWLDRPSSSIERPRRFVWEIRRRTPDRIDVAYSPDGKRLPTVSEDGTVQVYALDDRDLINLARSRVTRNFVPDECVR